MPTSSEILGLLTRIAREAMPLAILWHVALAAVAVAVARGFRPSRRLGASLLAVPLASVSAVAFVFGQTFNALVLGAASLGVLLLGLRAGRETIERCSPTLAVWALFLLEFAWLYPHFLADHFVMAYLYAAPLGLLPCPTLAAVIGLSILGSGFGARGLSTLLGGLGVFYGLFGALRLGVAIDVLLAIGGFVLLGMAWSSRPLCSGRSLAGQVS